MHLPKRSRTRGHQAIVDPGQPWRSEALHSLNTNSEQYCGALHMVAFHMNQKYKIEGQEDNTFHISAQRDNTKTQGEHTTCRNCSHQKKGRKQTSPSSRWLAPHDCILHWPKVPPPLAYQLLACDGTLAKPWKNTCQRPLWRLAGWFGKKYCFFDFFLVFFFAFFGIFCDAFHPKWGFLHVVWGKVVVGEGGTTNGNCYILEGAVRMLYTAPGMDLMWGGGCPPPPCCDEASRYASQKNPVTD